MIDYKSTEKERTQLEQAKTELLQALHANMQEEKEAVLDRNMERLEKLGARAFELMAKIDAADVRLRELVSPILEGQDTTVPLTDEQKWLMMEMKQLHKQVTEELIKQRTAVVEQMKELREMDKMIDTYKKELSIEGAFVDRKK